MVPCLSGKRNGKPADSQVVISKRILKDKQISLKARGQIKSQKTVSVALTSIKKGVDWVASLQRDTKNRKSILQSDFTLLIANLSP